MTYKFVTREEIIQLQKLILECPLSERHIYLGDTLSLAERLLAERDAYREVAIKGAKKDGLPIGWVDAEAARIMESK